MNTALPKIRDEFSDDNETGSPRPVSEPEKDHHFLPNPQYLPGLRRNSRFRSCTWPASLGLIALVVFGWDLAGEPHFADESAYISQSYFADLWLGGRWDDPAWLSYAGFDLPPLPKYAIGLAMRVEGHRRPGPSAMAAWYRNINTRFVSNSALVAARHPSVFFGALGCVSIFAIGSIAFDRRVGWVASMLLLVNPLYALHARRAMSDVPAESLILASLAAGLWSWRRIVSGRPALLPGLVLVFGAGILGGLATLSKLNGSLAGMILGVWALLAIALPGSGKPGKLGFVLGTIGAGSVSFATFALLNPFLFAHPPGPLSPATASLARLGFFERVKLVADHRVEASANARSIFPKDALNTAGEKVKALVVQGFGRFGPLGPRGRSDSTIRQSWAQDGGAVAWLPLVLLGFLASLAWGRAQLRAGEPPAAWTVASQAVVVTGVVTAFIPLAWDRYFLSIQPGFALLGAAAFVAGFDLLLTAFAGRKGRAESEL